MALDQKAGQVRRSVSALRNFQITEVTPEVESPKLSTAVLTPSYETPSFTRRDAVPEVQAQAQASHQTAAAPSRVSSVQAALNSEPRVRKLSFNSSFSLEARFKKARLKGGFNTLEDAHNEAIKIFCELVETGKLDRF